MNPRFALTVSLALCATPHLAHAGDGIFYNDFETCPERIFTADGIRTLVTRANISYGNYPGNGRTRT